MKGIFHVAEMEATLSSLAIPSLVLVLIFGRWHAKIHVAIAQGIGHFSSNSPFFSWLALFAASWEKRISSGCRGCIAALLVAVPLQPDLVSRRSRGMGLVTFATTWSFFFTTPGVLNGAYRRTQGPGICWRVSFKVSSCYWRLCRLVLASLPQLWPITECLELPSRCKHLSDLRRLSRSAKYRRVGDPATIHCHFSKEL